MMDLIEDDQGFALLGAHPVQRRVRGDLGVGNHHALILRRGLGAGIGESRIQGKTVPLRSLRPLDLQVLGGHHYGDLLDGPMAKQFGRDSQRERRFPGSGGGHGQEIARLGGQVLHQRPALPAP
jgi:hypothetical protein